MASITKVNGIWVRSTGLESGREMEVRLISETGNTGRLMGKELTLGKMETFMKGTGQTV